MKTLLSFIVIAVSIFGMVLAISAAPTELTFWTSQRLHIELMEAGVAAWNKLHPDQEVVLKSEVYTGGSVWNRALTVLQSGVGAPDFIDIEMQRFPDFLKDPIQLVELNSIVEPELEKFVKSRFDLYAKDGKYYGIDSYVGVTVMYYNTEILNTAGVDVDTIDTWADFVEAGKQVLAKTGKPMMTIEANDVYTHWALISQRGSDFLDNDGNPIIDDAVNISALQFQHDLVFTDKIAVVAPGIGIHDKRPYFEFLNQGGAAAIMMPMWYMSRFVNFMPDLKGKIIVRFMPRWEKGGPRTTAIGGTGTAITNQTKNVELAKGVLAQAKLTQEANLRMWNLLGFDPPRWDVWPMLKDQSSNKFTDYFGNNISDLLMPVKDEIHLVHTGELLPKTTNMFRSTINFVVTQSDVNTADTLRKLAENLRNQ